MKNVFVVIAEKVVKTINAIKDYFEGKKWLKFYYEAMQRHHDYYVFLYRDDILEEEDKPNYELAMAREADGEVDPLPEGAINYFNVEKEKQKESKG